MAFTSFFFGFTTSFIAYQLLNSFWSLQSIGVEEQLQWAARASAAQAKDPFPELR
jgi:hypothetical protein